MDSIIIIQKRGMQALTKQMASLSVQNELLVVYNELNLLHTSSRKHPETPERVTAIIQSLQKMVNLRIEEVSKAQSKGLLPGPSFAEVQALTEAIQGAGYVEFIRQMWDPSYTKSELIINKDTYFMKHTYPAAIEAVRTTLLALHQLNAKKINHFYSVIRPPGHHSGLKSQPHGFCFLNSVAITAQYAIRQKMAGRIAIIDWDAHHGQGTQKLFYNRNDVLYLSLHRYDEGSFFPHLPESDYKNIGQGKGKGHNINICWDLPTKKQGQLRSSEETVGNLQYSVAFRRIVMPILHQYKPDLILVSCGFDSGEGDVIGSMHLNSHGYIFMTQQLMGLNKPMGFVLEGGYNLDVLQWASKAIARAITGQLTQSEKEAVFELEQTKDCNQIGQKGIKNTMSVLSEIWKLDE